MSEETRTYFDLEDEEMDGFGWNVVWHNEALAHRFSTQAEAESFAKRLQNKDYALTVRVPIAALDDPEARKRVKELLADPGGLIGAKGARMKLQQIYKDRGPRRVATQEDS
jgi:hypothetical protein